MLASATILTEKRATYQSTASVHVPFCVIGTFLRNSYFGHFFREIKSSAEFIKLQICYFPWNRNKLFSFSTLPHFTVWNFQDFSVTQILREINFEKCRSSKTAYFAILGALNFVDLCHFQPAKSAKIHENQNSKPLIVLKWQFFGPQNQ